MSIMRVPVAHRSPVYALGTTQEADGRWRIFTVGYDRTIRGWDAATGAADGFVVPAAGPTVNALVATNLGGLRVLIYSELDGLHRLDRDSGARLGRPIRAHTAGGVAVVGSILVAGSGRGTIGRWDVATGEPLGSPLAGHEGAVTAVAAFRTADGRAMIVSGGADRTVRRWDAESGEPLGPPLDGHRGTVVDVCFAAGSGLLISQTDGGAIRRWDTATGAGIGRPLRQPAAVGRAGGLAVTPDGQVLFSVDGTRALNRWDLTADTPIARRLSTPAATVSLLAMAGPLLVSATQQGMVRRWHPDGEPAGKPLTGHPTSVNLLAAASAFGPPVFLSAGADGVRGWDAATGAPVGDPDADPVPAGTALAAAWLEDGSRLLAATNVEGALSRYDVLAGTLAFDPDETAVVDVAMASLYGTGALIAAMTADGRILRLDAGTGRPLGAALPGHGEQGLAVAATTLPGGTVLLAGAGDDGRILRWDAVSGEPAGEPLHCPEPVLRLGFRQLPDGPALLLAVDEGGAVRRWDAVTGKPIGEPLAVDGDPFLPLVPVGLDPSRLMVASAYEHTRCWDAATGEPLGDVAQADCAAVLPLPDGRIALAVGHEDGTLEIIRMAGAGPAPQRLPGI
ncbi:WD40 repeat domain-containing protein [Actinoplanes sp. NPDC051343]|uniref:WD40 repeat domain-containing protein n=1 Tax=Actinoplanes sp. NPDC051343 TaxID=3363906 RepID=UPI0037968B88